MVYGFRIVEDMISGLSNFMDQKGYRRIADPAAAPSRR